MSLNKRSMALLEKAFAAEIAGGLGLMQTKSKLAAQLVEEGYLMQVTERINCRLPVTVEGYRLTHLGRLTYCLSC